MYVSWIFAFAFYAPLISAELDISVTSQCKDITHDDIRIANRNCYTMHKSEKTWANAEKACEDLGGRLAVIEGWPLLRSFFKSSVVEEFIEYSVVLLGGEPFLSSGQYWVGAKDRRDDNFQWIDGREVPNEYWDKVSSVVSFVKDWFGKLNSCLTIQENGYEKESCSKTLAYICEHDFSAHDSGGHITNPNKTDGQETVTPEDRGNPDKTVKDIAAKETSQPRTTFDTQEVVRIPKQRPQEIDDENGHTIENEAPKGEPETVTSILQVFKGVRSVCNQFNPRLIAKPDQIEKARGVVECLRVCYDRSDCNLVNFFPPDHCAMYSDPARVRELGVVYTRGWTVWKTENVRVDLDECESTRGNGI